jgi:hypothetical protein
VAAIPSEALLVAYYLSKFNNDAYERLGYPNKTSAHSQIARALGTNANSLKLRRDDFDPLHGHRAGWHQHKLSGRLREVVQALQNIPFDELSDLVADLVAQPANFRESEDGRTLLSSIDRPPSNARAAMFYPRGPTGRRAEEYFVEWHAQIGEPLRGSLVDRRDDGCGYDYEIRAGDDAAFVEVKGLDGEEGGVICTSKEWRIARSEGVRYYLAVIRNVWAKPSVQLIQDPVNRLSARRQITRPVQISWAIPSTALRTVKL